MKKRKIVKEITLNENFNHSRKLDNNCSIQRNQYCQLIFKFTYIYYLVMNSYKILNMKG